MLGGTLLICHLEKKTSWISHGISYEICFIMSSSSKRIFSFSSPTAHSADGLLLLDFLYFRDNLKPCDWSDCPKARLSLVETGSNVSEEDQVLGSRGKC